MKKKNNLQKHINLCLLMVLFLALVIPFQVRAERGVTFTPQVGIPGSDFRAGEVLGITGRSFIDYLVAFYQWAVGAIAILAVVMIMVAGFQWMAAAGNAAVIGKAKNRISNSLVGLLLAVGAYSLLNFINPSLVNLRTLDLEPIEYVPLFTTKASCQDGYLTYAWDGHYCYDMPGYSTFESQYYPISDFVNADDLLQNPELMRGAEIKLDLGVHADRIANCDVQNNFQRFLRAGSRADTIDNVVLTYDPPTKSIYSFATHFSFFTGEHSGITASLNYDDYDATAVPLLKGLNIGYAGRTDEKLASAYVKNIVIQTKKYCATCCQKYEDNGSLSVNFFNTLDSCPDSWEKVDASICCDKYSNKDCGSLSSEPKLCGAIETLCNGRCIWQAGAGANGMCGTGI
jgi:hypothetical protein